MILKYLIIGFLLILSCLAEDLYFGRAQVCLEEGEKGCRKWNTTINLSYSYYRSFYYMCFPEQTRVLTKVGPKNIN